jgi:DNA-binding MarR family transcriptional regulator
MFSENHHKILQSFLDDESTSQELSSSLGLPTSMIQQLIDELCENGFLHRHHIYADTGTSPINPIDLTNKGQAAIESPHYFLGKSMTTNQGNNWYGDRVAGDKFTGDKVMGNKVQIGTVQGDAVAGNKIVNAQNLTQAAQDIKTLLEQLTIDYPNDDEFTQAGRAVGAIKNNPTLKQRLINAAKESGTTAIEKAIEAVVDNPAVSIVVAGVKGFIEAEG